MDSNLPQSKSVPSNLITGRRHRVSISGSGSYQSHLSSLGQLHRVRTISEQISLHPANPAENYIDLRILEGGLASEPRQARAGRLFLLKQIVTDPATFLSDDLRRILSGHIWRLRTLLTLYGCLCVLLFTIKIYTSSREAFHQPHPSSWRPVAQVDIRGTPLPPLMNVSLSQRLSVAFRELSPQAHLDTFVVRGHINPSKSDSDLTACLWIEDVHIEEALVSTAEWPGPASLVVVTTRVPNSAEHKNLLGYLTTKRVPANTSVHVLYVPSVTGGSSNTYLNMARFFARTYRVVLFPDGIPKSAVSGHSARWLYKLPIDTPHPVLLGNGSHRAYPGSKLSAPIVLPRDHPVWCSERFYLFGSRALDWDDCVWKLWLESGGEASSMAVSRFGDGFNLNATASVSPFVMKMRLRWSAKYRSEACVFALKRWQALGSLSRVEKKHMQWRKKFCREVKLTDHHTVTLDI